MTTSTPRSAVRSNSAFVHRGRVLPYFDHPYNDTLLNERAVELAIAMPWVTMARGEGLEVGNVLAHYGCTRQRRIVDLHEEADGVENVDVRAIEGRYDWIVAISTIEHVGWDDDRDPQEAMRAIVHLRSLLKVGGRMLLTAPTGWNPGLDQAIKAGATGAHSESTITRQFYGWHESQWPVILPYGTDGTRWANAVWIGEFRCY